MELHLEALLLNVLLLAKAFSTLENVTLSGVMVEKVVDLNDLIIRRSSDSARNAESGCWLLAQALITVL